MKRSSTGRYGVPTASALLILTGAALLAGCASPPSGTDNPTNAPPAATSGPGLPPSASTGLPGSANPSPAISLPAGADIGLSIAVKAGPEDPAKATTLICNGSSLRCGAEIRFGDLFAHGTEPAMHHAIRRPADRPGHRHSQGPGSRQIVLVDRRLRNLGLEQLRGFVRGKCRKRFVTVPA